MNPLELNITSLAELQVKNYMKKIIAMAKMN
jgi:hypothetical protein